MFLKICLLGYLTERSKRTMQQEKAVSLLFRKTGGFWMKRKEWTGGLYFIYLAFVVWVILLKFSTSPEQLPHLQNINLIPYGDSESINGQLDVQELVENILIFVPFGIYAGMLVREKSWWKVILAGAGFSLLLETLQYVFAIGASDITDVINNTLGAVLGVVLWKGFHRIAGERSWLIVQILATVGTIGMLGLSALLLFANT